MGLGAINVDIGGIVGGIGDTAVKIREALSGKKILDPIELQKIAATLEQAQIGLQNAQMEINKVEAASSSKFIAGWRPACGWLCVMGLAWQVFLWPIWVWISKLATIPEPPNIETAVLVTLLMGMLGLGTLRTYEKKEDIQDKH